MGDIKAIATAILEEWRKPVATLDEVRQNAARVEAEFKRRTRGLTAKERERVRAILVKRGAEGPELIHGAERLLVERHRLAGLLADVRTAMHRLSPRVEVRVEGQRRGRDFADERDAEAIRALEDFCQRHGVTQILDEREDRERAAHFDRLARIHANGLGAVDRWLDERAVEDAARHERSAAQHKTAIDAWLRADHRYADADVAEVRQETVEAVRQRRKVAKARALETLEQAKARKRRDAADKARSRDRKIRVPRRRRAG